MKGLRIFLHVAGGILLAAALERFLVAAGSAQILALPEPGLGIPLRYALLLIGGFELTVALICLFGKRIGLQLGWLAWLATNFIVYRIGLVTMHIHPQATCIGSLTDPLHLASMSGGYLVESFVASLALASYAALIWLWVAKPAAINHAVAADEFLKISCPFCGVHIKFSAQNLFQRIPCPQCQKAITLRRPAFFKMACVFCQEHIEFPAYAVGEKMPCPHCQMDITLKESA